uniref:Reverse transcriptase/retrotransposon-derived protein RNase H-like domain-containing protein n=1 Tax=Scophthalmus maximus TaxID=52904 RepID=A0A8D3B7W3_SCOMX
KIPWLSKRAWLAEYAVYDSTLHKATLKDATDNISWTEEMKRAFRHIKYLLCTAPALGLPDYKLTFHFDVAEYGLVASAVLPQTHVLVPCLRAVAAAILNSGYGKRKVVLRMLMDYGNLQIIE